MSKGKPKNDRVAHTPGPWRQGGIKEFSPTGKCREIVADDGRIGVVYGTTDDDCKANARLAEAALEMYQVIQRLAEPGFIGESELKMLIQECRRIVQKVV